MAEGKLIVYRGVPMAKGWPEEIEAAQHVLSYELNGRSFPRTRYGDERSHISPEHPCHDCRVFKGEFHVPGCDMEECPVCGEQLISCDCPFEE
jgi:hypothetical protein